MNHVSPHALLTNRQQERAVSRAMVEQRSRQQMARAAADKAHALLKDTITACNIGGHHANCIRAAAEGYAKAKAAAMVAALARGVPADPLPDGCDSEGGEL